MEMSSYSGAPTTYYNMLLTNLWITNLLIFKKKSIEELGRPMALFAIWSDYVCI